MATPITLTNIQNIPMDTDHTMSIQVFWHILKSFNPFLDYPYDLNGYSYSPYEYSGLDLLFFTVNV